jgi:hypothetical protein
MSRDRRRNSTHPSHKNIQLLLSILCFANAVMFFVIDITLWSTSNYAQTVQDDSALIQLTTTSCCRNLPPYETVKAPSVEMVLVTPISKTRIRGSRLGRRAIYSGNCCLYHQFYCLWRSYDSKQNVYNSSIEH